MRPDPVAATTTTATNATSLSVDPSRAWILGLVVGADGTISGPSLEEPLEWPMCACPAECDLHEAR